MDVIIAAKWAGKSKLSGDVNGLAGVLATTIWKISGGMMCNNNGTAHIRPKLNSNWAYNLMSLPRASRIEEF